MGDEGFSGDVTCDGESVTVGDSSCGRVSCSDGVDDRTCGVTVDSDSAERVDVVVDGGGSD